jgi:hypothetical protein
MQKDLVVSSSKEKFMRLLAVILAALSLSGYGLPQAPVPKPKPQDPGQKATQVQVWIYVAPQKELEAGCKGGQIPAGLLKGPLAAAAGKKAFAQVDILVPSELLQGPKNPAEVRLPFSCSKSGQFFEHKKAHPSHVETLIHLSRQKGDSAAFRSDTKFSITSIEDRDTKGPYPFAESFRKSHLVYNTVHETGPIVNAGADKKIYKVVLEINGYKIDPDIQCSP